MGERRRPRRPAPRSGPLTTTTTTPAKTRTESALATLITVCLGLLVVVATGVACVWLIGRVA